MENDSCPAPDIHKKHASFGRPVMLAALLCLGMIPGACATRPGEGPRLTKAEKIAETGHLTRQIIPAGSFDITAFTRINAPGQPVSVYIEGDGLSWVSRREPSKDPSPTDPVALRLAAIDDSPNVIYLARPCQYSRGKACERAYWTTARFAPEIIRAMDTALNDALRTTPGSKIRLVGFSGGGAVAALLAAKRPDVLDLRTVAGSLDPAAHSALHRVTPLSGSLNPVDFADSLRAVPQHHFIGGEDTNIPVSIYQSYAAALNHSPCTAYTIIPGVSHEDGWVDTWKNTQGIRPACQSNP